MACDVTPFPKEFPVGCAIELFQRVRSGDFGKTTRRIAIHVVGCVNELLGEDSEYLGAVLESVCCEVERQASIPRAASDEPVGIDPELIALFLQLAMMWLNRRKK